MSGRSLLVLSLALRWVTAANASGPSLSDAFFKIDFSANGITSLKRVDDAFDTNYIAQGHALGNLVIRYRRGTSLPWKRLSRPAFVSSGSTAHDVDFRTGEASVQSNLKTTERFQLLGKALIWTISLKNLGDSDVDVGDLGLPLPFNTRYVRNRTETYTRRLIRHSFIGENGSFVFWMRTNSVGPYLVMIPTGDASLEYFESSPQSGYTAFIHSEASGKALTAKGGNWRLPHTHLVLQPRGRAGDSKSYLFVFRWAASYAGVRQALYDEGGVDVSVVPGMTVPNDLTALISLHTRNKITAISAEYPGETRIKSAGERRSGFPVYAVRFGRLGENMLMVRMDHGRRLSLEFFVTQPLETLFKKRAAFIVSHEQHRNPTKWYDGLFSQWDMKNQKLRSPDDLDGLPAYAVACDDPILGKAAFVAGVNVNYPSEAEIAAVEFYIRHYVWGGLQETDKEGLPYAIYGIPNWHVLRSSPLDTVKGRKHVWRIYDYPHLILMYFEMFKIARNDPRLVHDLNANQYLQRAFGTAKAYFTVPYELIGWSAFHTGCFDELVIPHLIRALARTGHMNEAVWLRGAWERKVEYFVNDHPYLFGSEYPYDTTGFESTEALARYAVEHTLPAKPPVTNMLPSDSFRKVVQHKDAESFLRQQIRLNIASRGWLEPAYYDLGSDYRASGNGSYTLSYMSQMGGWAICDYALHYASDPDTLLRLGYASFLSSWALLNSGTTASNYGYWYPGKNNDGGASGGFEPRPWGVAWFGRKQMGRGPWWYSGEIDLGFGGALRTAATIVVDDPIFGPFAYGGRLTLRRSQFAVVPLDGLRTRFHVLFGRRRFQLLLGRDGFKKRAPIAFDRALTGIRFVLENRGGGFHFAGVSIEGLSPGEYVVRVGAKTLGRLSVSPGRVSRFEVPMRGASAAVWVHRIRE